MSTPNSTSLGHMRLINGMTLSVQLGVPLEPYRTWDSGRPPVRRDILTRANELALGADPHALRPLATLARLVYQRSLYVTRGEWQCGVVNELRQLRRNAALSQR
jgi:hypothetical protein